MRALIFPVQKALPLMCEGGSIIVMGRPTGKADFGIYSASRPAIRKLARSWTGQPSRGLESGHVLSPGDSLLELQKSEPKRLKSLSRAQNATLRETVDLPRDSGVALLTSPPWCL